MPKIPKRLLLVAASEDSSLLGDIGEAGYDATAIVAAAHAELPVDARSFDAIVVDVAQADVGRFAARQGHRDDARATPLLVILTNADAKGRIAALDAGADDSLCRPFDPDELRARLDALVRRSGQETLALGAFVWHWNHRQAVVGSLPLTLSPCETMLLEELLKSPDRIVSTQTLSRRIERETSGDTLNRLYVYICRLRKKLSASKLRIRSASGLGYSLDTRGIAIDRFADLR